jgi:hypothetical protein
MRGCINDGPDDSMKAHTWVATALLLAACTAQSANLTPFHADFTVSRNGKSLGTMRMELSTAAPGEWLFVSHTEGNKGLAGFLGVTIDERSRLSEVDGSLSTLSYNYQQDMVARHRARSLSVSADGAVRELDNGKSWRYNITRPMFDRHAAVLGIATQLADQAEVGSIFNLPIASKGKLESWRFLVVGEEDIETGSGTIKAVRVERMRENADRKTISWHAAQYGYLPVKVEQTEPDGERLTSVLQSYSAE